MQLHLKQIARTLRASRVETSHAIGEALKQGRGAAIFRGDVAQEENATEHGGTPGGNAAAE